MILHSYDDLWDIIGYVKALAFHKIEANKGDKYGD
jgi:hypothetical protein